MGIRIVVVLQHDLAHIWAADKQLGEKILSQVSGFKDIEIIGGKVIEFYDDSMQSLILLDGGDIYTLAAGRRKPGLTHISTVLRLLRSAAGALGFNLTEKLPWQTRKGL